MIIFEKVRWKNLLSYGNTWTEILLNKSSTTIIQGKNGSGKSTLGDAICFALYGKPLRKINKPTLVNQKNKRDMVVEITFNVDGVSYKVVRGISPGIFEIFKDGVLINQDSVNKDYQKYLEDYILKVDYQIFTQIMVLSKSTHTPFMKLSSSDRRKFIETMLNLNIFSVMNDIHKTNISSMKEKLNEARNNLVILKEKIQIRTKYIKDLESDQKVQHEKLKLDIQAKSAALDKEIEELEVNLVNLESLIVDINDEEYNKVKLKIQQIEEMTTKSIYKIQTFSKSIEFFTVNDSCPTCKHVISQSDKDVNITELTTKVTETQQVHDVLKDKLSTLTGTLNSFVETTEHNAEINKKISSTITLVKDKRKQKKAVESENVVIDSDKIDTEKQSLTALKEIFETEYNTRLLLVEKSDYYEIISGMLKDTGIKSHVIKRYIPLITSAINNNLQQLGFFVKFVMDENFNETILSRGIDELNYYNFSEGEKLRIDLSILLAWREISKLQNNVSTNLLLFDEIFSESMDKDGFDSFIEMLTVNSDLNIFVIGHALGSLVDKFRSSIVFAKDQGFSKIVT